MSRNCTETCTETATLHYIPVIALYIEHNVSFLSFFKNRSLVPIQYIKTNKAIRHALSTYSTSAS